LHDLLPAASAPDPGSALDRFLDWVAATGLAPYRHQVDALAALAAGKHVILGTPTGSGKSLVAIGLHFMARAAGQRSFYTSPTKALTSEKFFNLCALFDPEAVGMLTGDASINREAPIVCCTTEILAHMALREAPADLPPRVVMDEFHFYADGDRGWAWQVPLVAMRHAQFLLMSATLGDPAEIALHLRRHTDRDVAVILSDKRPVPLDYAYRETPIHATIQSLAEARKLPAYVVSFTHRECAELAQSLTSLDLVTRADRARIADALEGAVFDTPYGKDLRRFLRGGIAVHYAGLLPKYRLLVEQLAQEGLLKVICGTDTLGVGVNIPIRTVVFTALAKYDGQRVRMLSARDFRQIAGRAGRKGFDDRGSVVCQAPAHEIENKRRMGRAAAGGPGGAGRGRAGGVAGKSPGDRPATSRGGQRWGPWNGGRGPADVPPPGRFGAGGREWAGRGQKKGPKRKAPPRGAVVWNRATFDQLVTRPPAPLAPRFRVTHGMLIHALQRQSAPPGYAFLVDVILRCHMSDTIRPRLLREAAVLFRSLRHAGIVEVRRDAAAGRSRVVVDESLQADFSLDETLSLYLVETVVTLDPAAGDYALRVLSLVEAILEDPQSILTQQVRKARAALLARLKAEGVPYLERERQLEEVTYPRPLAELVEPTFRAFAARHPWVRGTDIHPKSIAREMFERGLGFDAYVRDYGLERGEGLLLRHLSQVYRTLVQTVPEPARTAAVVDIIAWLRATIEGVDASLIEAWERLERYVDNPEGGDNIGDAGEPTLP